MKKPLRVLHVTYDMRIGGTEMVIKNIIEGMDKESVVSSIFCIEEPLGPWGEDLKSSGVKVTSYNRKPGFDLQLVKQIHKAIKDHEINVLHCHQYTPWVYGTLAALFTSAKVVFTEHGRFFPDFSSWKRRFVNPILLAFTKSVTAISSATKQALVDFEFIPAKRIELIYNGIHGLVPDQNIVDALREKYKIPSDAKILGTVARMDPIKNQTMMIRAFNEILRDFPNTYLLIVGDGDEKSRLTSLVQELKITNRVVFTGYVAKPVNHIALIDIFLLSSLSEGTSMTLLEAMSLGKPCVVTNAGGNPEIIAHRQNGLVANNDDLDDFSQQILTLLKSDEFYNKACIESRNIFEEKFHVSKMCGEYWMAYQ